jgi:hypothetical protein
MSGIQGGESADVVARKPRNEPQSVAQEAAEMARYGITRVPVDYFHFREFRYSNLADALAEAIRHEHVAPKQIGRPAGKSLG